MNQGWHRAPEARPWVLGHRGARHTWPENTLLAFDKALDEGADGVELDVRVDGSGQVIVLHDPTLKRVTNGRDLRHVEDISSAALTRVRQQGEQPVATLAQVLSWARERSARVNIELKSDVRRGRRLLRSVCETVRATPGLYLFSSFSPAFVAWLARSLPEYPVAWLVHARQRWLREAPYFSALGAAGVHPEHSLITSARLSRWQAQGAFIAAWTVNAPERALALATAGVDGIISDVPGKILKALATPSERLFNRAPP